MQKEVNKGSWFWRVKVKFICWFLKTFYKNDTIAKDFYQVTDGANIFVLTKNFITMGDTKIIATNLVMDEKGFIQKKKDIDNLVALPIKGKGKKVD